MQSALAIRKFLQEGEHGQPTAMSELRALQAACSKEEWAKMGKDSCEALGVEWEPPKVKP